MSTSTYQILAMLWGVIGGIIWEKAGTSPYKNIPTITPSLIVKFSGMNLHLHHWLAYALIILLVTAVSVKTGRIFHPSVLMILSFLLAALLYDIFYFPDWHVFLS